MARKMAVMWKMLLQRFLSRLLRERWRGALPAPGDEVGDRYYHRHGQVASKKKGTDHLARSR
jgi:hypothetical protein